jgi:hypothetical protein
MALSADERRARNRLAAQRSRARQSSDDRVERLRKQRERNRIARSAETAAARAERVRQNRERRLRVSATPAPEPQPASDVPTVDERHRAWGSGEIPRLRPVSAASKSDSLRRLRLPLGLMRSLAQFVTAASSERRAASWQWQMATR